MTLIRFEPLRELDTFSKQFDKYFNELNSSFEMREISPKTDIYETDENLFVEIEAPGIKKEGLKLTIEDNILTITGEKKQKEMSAHTKCYRSERSFGSFKRSFTLPVDINPDKTTAKFEDGVLLISMEKFEEVHKKEKSIELK